MALIGTGKIKRKLCSRCTTPMRQVRVLRSGIYLLYKVPDTVI